MSGEFFVSIPLKRRPFPDNLPKLEPPIKKTLIAQFVPPKVEIKKMSTTPKEKTEIRPKKLQNRLKMGGETYKVGDFAYITDRKCIGRIESINHPIDESRTSSLDITWYYVLQSIGFILD